MTEEAEITLNLNNIAIKRFRSLLLVIRIKTMYEEMDRRNSRSNR